MNTHPQTAASRPRPSPRRRLLFSACAATLLTAVLVLATACGPGAGRADNYGAVSFSDPSNGWITGWDAGTARTVLARTTDGGKTWTKAKALDVPYRIVGWTTFATPVNGVWCIGVNRLLWTPDGGVSWAVATVRGLKGGYVTEAEYTSPAVGWASALNSPDKNGGAVAVTTDGGMNWLVKKKIRGLPGTGGFVAVAAPSDLVCHAVKRGVAGGDWVTTDGGTTWVRHRLPVRTRRYNAIAFYDALNGCAVGAAGMIATTTNGGATWSARTSGVTTPLLDVCITSPTTAYAVGNAGVILSTADGGTTWVKQTSGVDVVLRDVEFVSPTEGWIMAKVGWADQSPVSPSPTKPVPVENGPLLHTTDGGSVWTK